MQPQSILREIWLMECPDRRNATMKALFFSHYQRFQTILPKHGDLPNNFISPHLLLYLFNFLNGKLYINVGIYIFECRSKSTFSLVTKLIRFLFTPFFCIWVINIIFNFIFPFSSRTFRGMGEKTKRGRLYRLKTFQKS